MPIASTVPRPADPPQRTRLRAVDVAFTHAGARRADVTVVIDVLRATTTIVRAFEAGYRQAQHLTVELSATVIGDPGLLAKTVVEIQGISQRLSGKYYLREAKHKVDASFTIDLKRDGALSYDAICYNGAPDMDCSYLTVHGEGQFRCDLVDEVCLDGQSVSCDSDGNLALVVGCGGQACPN